MGRKTVADGAAGTWAPAVGEHLTWIRDVLGKLDLPAARRDKLWSALRTVQTRVDDPELRIAVFGEASSGKSTLLNAFLRRRLLPSSARVTTTVTTVLRHHDGTEGLRLRAADGTELDWPSAAFDQWAGGPHTPSADGLEAALNRVLTTDLALRVRGLEVRSPVRPLGDGVAVLDTPGFSVTDPDTGRWPRPLCARRIWRWWSSTTRIRTTRIRTTRIPVTPIRTTRTPTTTTRAAPTPDIPRATRSTPMPRMPRMPRMLRGALTTSICPTSLTVGTER